MPYSHWSKTYPTWKSPFGTHSVEPEITLWPSQQEGQNCNKVNIHSTQHSNILQYLA